MRSVFFVLFFLLLAGFVYAVPVRITADGEAYGHHGNCFGWNSCGSAANCALWACKANGFSEVVFYGAQKPCTEFNNCQLLNSDFTNGVTCNWGNSCAVMGVTDIWCDNGVPTLQCLTDLPDQSNFPDKNKDHKDISRGGTAGVLTVSNAGTLDEDNTELQNEDNTEELSEDNNNDALNEDNNAEEGNEDNSEILNDGNAEIPEFGVMAGVAALVGALVIFMYHRKN